MERRARVVITGLGTVSPLGSSVAGNLAALKEGRSGISLVEEWRRRRIGSQIGGIPEPDPPSPLLTRRMDKTTSSAAKMALAAASEALTHAGFELEALRGSDLPVMVGIGTGSTITSYEASLACENAYLEAEAQGRNGVIATRRVNPYTVPKVMGSTASAAISVALGSRGESWALSSACSTGAHAIGMGGFLIRHGLYERALVGAADEVDWTRAGAFDAMRALSRGFNERPTEASRPFARDRDGFVISGGAGLLVLESLEAAQERGATILAELIGYGATSDGHEMVAPLPEGAVATMRKALDDAGVAPDEVDYVNAHGTSTPQGDPSEARAMAEVFGERQPLISSTKSMTGHGVGAAGALEAIYTILMLRESFVAPSLNVTPENVDPECAHLALVFESPQPFAGRVALTNSFGFGGTNACLVLRRWDES